MLWTRGVSKGCMQPPVKCVSYNSYIEECALLVENLDLIPGYRCSEQQDAAEFLNGVITGINGLFAKQRLCKSQLHTSCAIMLTTMVTHSQISPLQLCTNIRTVFAGRWTLPLLKWYST